MEGICLKPFKKLRYVQKIGRREEEKKKKKSTTLGDKLVHSYLPPTRESSWLGVKLKGCFKCHHCNHWDNVMQGKTFLDVKTKKDLFY